MKKVLLLFLTLCFVLFTACDGSGLMDDMFENYDEPFTPMPTSEPDIQAGSEGFDETQMLKPVYPLLYQSTFNESAPSAASYKWEIYSYDKETHVSRSSFDNYSRDARKPRNLFEATKNARNFSIHLPETDLQIGETYELELIVTDESGNVYSDTADFILYRHFEDIPEVYLRY